MQFREQGKKIQCIRSTYESATKRSHQKVVGAFDRQADKLPLVGLEDLTGAEKLELEVWFAARQSVKIRRMHEYRLMNAGLSLAQLCESIAAMGGAITEYEAMTTLRGLNDVMKALRKAGYPKPKPERFSD